MKTRLFIPLILAGLMFSCAPSTQLIKSWSDPSLTPETVKPFNKVLVIARIKDETGNRIAEDKIAAQLKSPAVPSNAYFTSTDIDPDLIDERLRADGFDGLIVMKLTDINKTLDYQPGTAYGGYYRGYYGVGYGSPGYLTVDHTFYVETSIYSLVNGKILWTGTTSTLNPTQLEKSIDDIIIAVKTELESKGLIKPN